MLKNEKIVETKKCKMCQVSFDISDNDLIFYDKVSPLFWWNKFSIPTPTFCQDCRQQRRLSFRNERKLYKRKCDETGREIVSIYSPDKNIKVYENSYWWSDKWDAIDFGRDFDFDKLFFEQFSNLLNDVPRINLYLQEAENSPYSNYELSIKNCYLTVGWHWNEDCMYGNYYIHSKDSIDNYWLFHSDNCYECFNSYNLHNCFYLQYSNESSDCFLWYDLKNCSFCFGCIWLRNKKYYIFNKSYSKTDYLEKIKELDITNYSNLKKLTEKFNEIKLKVPHKNLNIVWSENCVWDDIFNSKNIKNSYSVEDVENWSHSLIIWMWKDCMDLTSVWLFELFYEFASWWMNGYKNVFSQSCYWCTNIYYSDNCHYCSNLFWCVWLRNKEYCIFNKQYSKEEYDELVPKIIEHMKKTSEWWEFFPSSISPFWYNETIAQEYYPLEKWNALNLGYNWSTFEQPIPKVEKIIPANKLPNYISDIPDDVLNWAIECEVTKRPFKIMKAELDFYRKHGLFIPRKHPDIRHLDRMKLKNEMKIYNRKCEKCWENIKSTYNPNKKEIIYCEKCYEKLI